MSRSAGAASGLLQPCNYNLKSAFAFILYFSRSLIQPFYNYGLRVTSGEQTEKFALFKAIMGLVNVVKSNQRLRLLQIKLSRIRIAAFVTSSSEYPVVFPCTENGRSI
jgi:hypothetical protein